MDSNRFVSGITVLTCKFISTDQWLRIVSSVDTNSMTSGAVCIYWSVDMNLQRKNCELWVRWWVESNSIHMPLAVDTHSLIGGCEFPTAAVPTENTNPQCVCGLIIPAVGWLLNNISLLYIYSNRYHDHWYYILEVTIYMDLQTALIVTSNIFTILSRFIFAGFYFSSFGLMVLM